MNKQIESNHRGDILKQIIQIDDEQKQKIIEIEKECEIICHELEEKYQPEFKNNDKQLVIELIRKKKGKLATALDILEADYESFIEVGIEHEEEYYPNAYIPIWKCKGEWFQKIGYLTRRTKEQLNIMISSLVKEMLADKEGE
jgi:signal recognition particle subunit SEC65